MTADRAKAALPHVLFLVGPTASGKTDFAIEAAGGRESSSVQSEILNCDSIQFFQGLDIGAAKPSSEQQRRVRHHLIGHRPLGSEYTAGEFRRDALAILASEKTKSFMAVGGSGFYVQALEKGMYPVPQVPAEVRSQLESEILLPGGRERLHAELARRDPEAAKKIHPADRYRILRALEILRSSSTDETMAQIRARFDADRPTAPFSMHKLGLTVSREELRRRIESRTRQMLKSGLIEEVEGLRSLGLASWAPAQSVGYFEVQNYLDGRLTRQDLEAAIVTSTMQLAKRQMTWFKRDPEVKWFDSVDSWDQAARLARELILGRALI